MRLARPARLAFVLALLLTVLPAGPARAACSSPAGLEGEIIYNTDFKVYQFCDGTDWWSMKDTENASAGSSLGSDDVLEVHLKSVNEPTDEYCLTYETTTGDFEWQSCGGGNLNDLGDVSLSSPASDEVLTYNGSNWVNGALTLSQLPAIALGDLSDATISSPASGEVLSYNGSNWVNQTISTDPAGSDRQIQFNSGGSFGADANFVFDSAGRLGIGTATPAAQLTIYGPGSAATAGILRIEDDAGASANLRIGVDDVGDYSWIQSHGSRPLHINALGNDVIFQSNGFDNVGIGTASPAWPLHVEDTTTSSSDITENLYFGQFNYEPASATGGTSNVRRAAEFNVDIPATNTVAANKIIGVSGTAEHRGTGDLQQIDGVTGWGYNQNDATVNSIRGVTALSESDNGTVSELVAYDGWSGVYGGSVTDHIGLRLYLSQGTNDLITDRYGIQIIGHEGTVTGDDYGIYQTGGAKNYFADPVGIGANSPTATLDLIGPTTQDATTIELARFTTGNVDCSGMTDMGGVITVGQTTQTAQFGAIRTQCNAGAGVVINSDDGSGVMTERLRITEAGNVGIGTASPDETLHVAGNVKVDGDCIGCGGPTSDTAIATTSGTAHDFTGIPSGVNQIEVMFDHVGGANPEFFIQIGDSGGVETSGYDSWVVDEDLQTATSTEGFRLTRDQAGNVNHTGIISLRRLDGNQWIVSGHLYVGDGVVFHRFSGVKTLSGELDRVRIWHDGGTFDEGKVNIQYQ